MFTKNAGGIHHERIRNPHQRKYNTDGGTKEWSYFTEYLSAGSAAEAKRIKKSELKADGYHNITMDAIET